MIRTLTKKDIKRIDKDMDEWWSKLDPCTKHNIYHFLKSVQGYEDIQNANEDQEKKDRARFWKMQKQMERQYEEAQKLTKKHKRKSTKKRV